MSIQSNAVPVTPRLSASRTGNAIVLVMGVIVLAASMLVVSTQFSMASSTVVSGGSYQQLALAAAEAVAARQETTIATYANAGDPASWVNMSDKYIAGNYGESWLGGIRVRWKVEPAATATVASTTGSGWNYIVNPPPDTTTTPAAPRVGNDATYLFRIAAEACYLDGTGANAKVLARAQAVRFASVDKLPLFRYVIFYAKNGPKGDLEFSHGPGVKVRGNVHSNGAIYLGGGTQTNDYNALLKAAGGASTSTDSMYPDDLSATILGPDQNNKSVRVCGVDGIFRLSKQVPFGVFNDFPMAGTSPGGSSLLSWYNISATPAQGEIGTSPNYKAPNFSGGTLLDRTWGGRVINPNRITDVSYLVTRQTAAADDLRKINGVAIRGSTNTFFGTADSAVSSTSKANDARDVTRTNYKWESDSLKSTAPGFSGYARSSANGGAAIPLAKSIANRPLEAQGIIQPTYKPTGALAVLADGVTPDQSFPRDNPITSDVDEEENHWAALPLFIKSDGTETALLPATRVEKPGAQLKNALNRDDAFFVRRSPFSGWDIKKNDGVTAPTADVKPVGLIIRERPVPDMSLAPALTYPSTTSAEYMPYVYGKPRPGQMPFLAVDVADSMSNYETNSEGTSPYGSATRNTSALVQGQAYAQGGQLTFSAANRSGPGANTSNGYTRQLDYFRENWRMFNLKNINTIGTNQSFTTTDGLRATYFTTQNFTGPSFVRADANIDFNWGSGSPLTGVPADSFSVRWQGKITAPAAGSYVFSAIADDVCRIWVDGKLVLQQNYYNGENLTYGSPITLEKATAYSFMVEFVEGSGGANCKVHWSYPSQGTTIVPSTAFDTTFVGASSSSADFRKEPFFRLNDFKAVEMRIENLTNGTAANAKVALMIQDALDGASPHDMSGGSPYAAVCYTPQRGFYIQYRGVPSSSQVVTSNLFYIGGGTDSVTPLNLGQVRNPTATSVTRSATLTLAAYGTDPTPTNETGTRIVDNKVGATFTTTNNPWSTSEGTVDKVILGPRSFTFEKQPQAYRRSEVSLNSNWSVAGLDAAGSFLFSGPNDRDQNITLYTGTTGSAIAYTINKNWNYAGTTLSKVDRTRSSTGSKYDDPWIDWGTKTSKTMTVGTAKTIFKPYPQYFNGGVGGRREDGASTVAYMNDNFGGGFSLATTAEEDVTHVAPSTPAVNSPLPTKDMAVLAAKYPTGSRTFSLPRTVTPTLDLNSYVTRWGPWFPATQFQWLPYMDGYTDWRQNGIGDGINPTAAPLPAIAKARSYRPDSWYFTNWLPSAPPAPPIDTSVAKSLVGSPRWLDDLPAGSAPAVPSATNHVWLRIEKTGSDKVNSTKVRFLYYVGSTAPASAAAYTAIKNGAEDVVLDLAGFGQGITYSPTTLKPASNANDRCVLIGPALQSGNVDTKVEVTVSSMKVETNFAPTGVPATDLSVWDATKWENNGAVGPNDMSRYLASQYQVFFGTQEITEDFFSFSQANATTRLATEDWIYNIREFWSQSKWWDGNMSRSKFKESITQGSAEPNFLPTGGVSQRELFSKMTLLTLNLRGVQDYLRTRTIDQAIVKSISTSAVPPATGTGVTLASRFNKLIYASRTNRYPVNPRNGFANPWNPDLPNTTDDMTNLGAASLAVIKAMQPYALPYAPAFRSEQFFQGVRIINGSVIDWERPASGTPVFGNSKLSIVTPGQLFIQGNFNYTAGTWPGVTYKGGTTADATHPVPVALMGDAVTFLSNAFNVVSYQLPGLSTAADGSSVTGGGTLAFGSAVALPVATETSYYAAVVTNNQPTTKDSVMNGESASFINTMTYLENWNAIKMTYQGSLVVLDTRRYANHYMLDAPKNYGWGPFGYHLTAASLATWKTRLGIGSINTWDNPFMPLSYVQGAPKRVLTFNYDLLTEQGTPPFTPFGVSVAGRGGWTKIIQ